MTIFLLIGVFAFCVGFFGMFYYSKRRERRERSLQKEHTQATQSQHRGFGPVVHRGLPAAEQLRLYDAMLKHVTQKEKDR